MVRRARKEKIQLDWHPDFRDLVALPDVKVVRTHFILNFVSLTILLCLIVYLGYQQVLSWDLRTRIAAVDKLVNEQSAANRVHLKDSVKFKKLAKKVEDLDIFYNQSETALDFLVDIVKSKPDNIAYNKILFNEQTQQISKSKSVNYGEYTVTGILQGSSAEVLNALNNFREIVEQLPLLKDKINEIKVSPPRRNPELDLFEFTIVIALKPITP